MVAILAIIALFVIVWRGAWGERSAVVGLAIVLGGAFSSLFDTFYLGASTAFLFLRVGASGRIETNFSLVAVIAGTIVLAVAAGMGRLPTDSIGPTRPRRRIHPTV
jgi:lipoprotein signal peptidase